MIPVEILNQVGVPVTALTQIAFECQRCGCCCSNRVGAPIRVTGYDMYRLASALGMRSTMELLEQQFVFVAPNSYGLPICVLSVTEDGSCCMMKNNLCSVHNAKPAVCALYPLGRVYDAEEGHYIYVQPRGNRCAGTGKGRAMAAAQWLEELKETEPFHAAHEQAYAEVAKAFLEITHQRYLEKVFYRTVGALFGGFDPQKDFLSQLEENMRKLRPLLKKANNNKKSR